MEIKVFGPGCARCEETEQRVRAVVATKGGAISVSKVTDLKAMMLAGVMSTPAVAIDGVVKSTGRIPGNEEIAAWIDGATLETGDASGAVSGNPSSACACSGCCCENKA